MTFEQIIDVLKCEVIHKGNNFNTASIINIFAGDIMGEVFLSDEENRIIVTTLTTDQVIKTAESVKAIGVILLNGKQPQNSMRNLTVESDITLLSTSLSMFEVCILLGKLLGKC
ncbi:MAG: hypothetical protein FWD87_00110 [Spirochaetaceae bacterium]|nr:hypothetical protein [Spirochaetaceae bacterium]